MNQSQLKDFLNLLKEKSEKSDYGAERAPARSCCEETTYQRCLKVLEGKKVRAGLRRGNPCMASRKTVFIASNLPEIEAIMSCARCGLSGCGALFLIEYGGAKRDYFHGKNMARCSSAARIRSLLPL